MIFSRGMSQSLTYYVWWMGYSTITATVDLDDCFSMDMTGMTNMVLLTALWGSGMKTTSFGNLALKYRLSNGTTSSRLTCISPAKKGVMCTVYQIVVIGQTQYLTVSQDEHLPLFRRSRLERAYQQ
jgi:hypothetical protein